MDMNAIGPYSPNTVYGEFTSPFTPKKININAHTPYDKNDIKDIAKSAKNNIIDTEEKVFNKDYFKAKNVSKNVYKNIADKNNYLKKENLTNEYLEENKIINKEETKNKTEKPVINTFSSSLMSNDSNKMIKNSLKNGYNTEEFIVIKKAQDAYNKSSYLTKDPVKSLYTCSYNVY